MFDFEIFEKLTNHARQSLLRSQEIATQKKQPFVQPIHLLQALLLEKGGLSASILHGTKLPKNFLSNFTSKNNIRANQPKRQPVLKKKPGFSPETKSALTRAYAVAATFGYPYVGTEHLLYALAESKDLQISYVFQKAGLLLVDLENILTQPNQAEFPKELGFIENNLTKQTLPATSPSYLEQFCVNLNEKSAQKNELLIGREKEMARLLDILGRKSKHNPILLGDPGVGKTALVQGLAHKINAGEVGFALANKKIYELDLALVVAGTTFRGEFENRLKEIIHEAAKKKDVILFIDEVHGIVGTGNTQGALDAANILKPALSSGKIQCIGATTYGEYKKYIEKDPALVRRFQPLVMAEPSIEDTVAIIEKTKHFYEKFHRVAIPKETIRLAVELSVRYLNERFLPDKAIDLIDEAASAKKNKRNKFENVKKIKELENELADLSLEKKFLVEKGFYDKAFVLKQKETLLQNKLRQVQKKQQETSSKNYPALENTDIAEVIARSTGIPLEKIAPAQSFASILKAEKEMTKQIVGQAEVLKTITETLIRSHAGIANPERPLGSFLFLGPTGVGKTLTAKILAQTIFANNQAFVRIDMSEFMEKHNLAQLLGAPAGYVGYEEGGKLTEKVRHNPYSLILFDEIEKAHPDMFNILLQILEDGTLTDAQGRSINFKNTILVLTSNLGSQHFSEISRLGFTTKVAKKNVLENFASVKQNVLAELKKTLRPEILNRLDQILVFNPFSQKELEAITQAELQKLAARLYKQATELTFTPEVSAFIAQKSYAPEYGARLVRKNIQDLVEPLLARHILGGKTKNGKIKIVVHKNNIAVK